MIRLSLRLGFVALCAWLTIALSGCASPPPPEPPEPGAIAAAYLAAGRVDEAVREIELAVRANPRKTNLRLLAAEIQERAGNTGRAVEHLETALLRKNSKPEVWIRLGEIETRRDNSADAYLAFRRAAELAPDDIRAVSGLALSADQLGFEEEAEAAYARWEQLKQGGSTGD